MSGILEEFDITTADMTALVGLRCELNHGPGTEETVYEAVDFLCQPIDGPNGTYLLRIPVCKDCAEALSHDSDWMLFYCINCMSSQWLNKLKSKKFYGETIIEFMDVCPKCYEGY